MRFACAMLLALLLGMRLLSPAGFMPRFEHGSVAIVACPDGEPAPAHMAGHDHGAKKIHQHCPYAAGASLATASAAAYVTAALPFAAPMLPRQPFDAIDRHRAHDRPPLRGPPIPA
jgi:hypothetical protein